MEKVIDFIKNNYLAILIGLFFYTLFAYYNIAGNSLCDCESTENYRPSGGGSRFVVGRFYHK